jgi:hypothetical protein
LSFAIEEYLTPYADWRQIRAAVIQDSVLDAFFGVAILRTMAKYTIPDNTGELVQ